MRPPAEAVDLIEALRRLANVVRVGAVAQVDLPNARARVRYGADPDGALTGWLPWIAGAAGEDRSWRPPSIGEQVLLLSPSGDLAAGWILPGAYSGAYPPPDDSAGKSVMHARDGAIISYDTKAHVLAAVLPAGGSASIEAPDGIEITGDVEITGGVTITGNVDINGDAGASGAISSQASVSDPQGSMAEMRTVYNAHTHIIPGPPPTPVPAPVQKMA